jgi:hypothetical protein
MVSSLPFRHGICLTFLLGESQPVYEEFGAILLLVLAVTNRYELAPSEIGISFDSFLKWKPPKKVSMILAN